jgi:hypothetical protein
MTSTESESTSPVSQDDQPLRTSRSSSATAASSATSASFDLSDLEEDDHHQPDVAIAGLDKGFDELDLGGGSEVAGGDVKQPNRAEEAVDVDHVGKDPRGTEEVSEKEGKDDTVERPEGYDEEDPVYPYTMALFEYTVSRIPPPLVSWTSRLTLRPVCLDCVETTIPRSSMAARTDGEGSAQEATRQEER